MSEEIKKLEPKEVWKHFYSLTQIPRPSGHEKEVEAFLVNFGKEHNLETIKDKAGNVIIRKPATKGMENKTGVILQAHVDMVPQKNSDVVHDFTKDPIDAYIDGEWVKARGTTLGSDNGMGAAAIMAILESKTLEHGPLEALFTATEETGMDGANGLKPGVLKGDILLNLDSETEGEFFMGCAGGLDANIDFKFKPQPVPKGYKSFTLSVKGLKGGHSGMDINLGRGNAIKIMFRYLNRTKKQWKIQLADVTVDGLRNAIPREAFSTILVPENKVDDIIKCVAKYEAIVNNELGAVEDHIEIKLTPVKMPKFMINNPVQMRLIRSIIACQNGVIRMSKEMPGVVETSSNLAIVKSSIKSGVGNIEVKCLLRSSVDSSKDALAANIGAAFELAGAEAYFDGAYPGWKPNANSAIVKLAHKVYKKKFNKEPKITAVHAGLECAILGAKYPNWDMMSFGPTLEHPHSPDERVNIKSVGVFYDFLCTLLKNIPEK